MPIFFTKKSCNRGGGTTPQMPLTVKAIKGVQGQKKCHTYFVELIAVVSTLFTCQN